jgi:predicted cupin superfamily sugar epimerase
LSPQTLFWLLLASDGPPLDAHASAGRERRLCVVGSDLAAGMRHQLLISGGAWHASRLKAGGSYALLGTIEFSGFDRTDLEVGDVGVLTRTYPDFGVAADPARLSDATARSRTGAKAGRPRPW